MSDTVTFTSRLLPIKYSHRRLRRESPRETHPLSQVVLTCGNSGKESGRRLDELADSPYFHEFVLRDIRRMPKM